MKRSELKRKTPLRSEPKPAKGPRMKKCTVCRNPFAPRNMTHKVCGPECAAKHAAAIRETQQRKDDRERRQSLKSRQDWLREAQAAFNAFIRKRDEKDPCISCGRFHDGQYHAGHFRSVGAAPALRFDENNVHKQCMPCNEHLSGNISAYRPRLIVKIGQFAVDLLETEYPPSKLTIEDARLIKETYKRKLKELTDGQ